MNKLILIFLLTTFFWKCGNKKYSCVEGNLETIFFDYDSKSGHYDHYVLLKDCKKEQMDSSKIIDLAINYYNNLSTGKPMEIIRIYSSTENFIENEISQPMSDINKNCLVLISLDKRFLPIEFIFYDKKGQWKYKGPLWRPNG